MKPYAAILLVMLSVTATTIRGLGGDYTLNAEDDYIAGEGAGGGYGVNMTGGRNPVGYFNTSHSFDYEARLGLWGLEVGCGNSRCGRWESAVSCPQDCCESDCSGQEDQVCHLECSPYCGRTVSTECDGKTTSHVCGDSQGVCSQCEYTSCTDYSCTDSCVDSRYGSADPVDNTCSNGQCTSSECTWTYTCSQSLASSCPGWECDDDTDCGEGRLCADTCECVLEEVKVSTDFQIDIDDETDREDTMWLGEG